MHQWITSLIPHRGPLPRLIQVIYQLATGLAYIHSKGNIHRDIKPANVLISSRTDQVTLKWADFGFCKEVSGNETFEMSAARGTAYWMAPEILRFLNREEGVEPNKKGSTKSDVFSAGCLFFKFVTKFHPFGNKMATEVTHNIESDNPVNFLNKSKSRLTN